MVDSQFRKLVNQYLDGEITAEETLLLEEEIRQFPRRRQEFKGLVVLHRACGAAFHLDGPEGHVRGENGLSGSFFWGSDWKALMRRCFIGATTASVSILVGLGLFYQVSVKDESALAELEGWFLQAARDIGILDTQRSRSADTFFSEFAEEPGNLEKARELRERVLASGWGPRVGVDPSPAESLTTCRSQSTLSIDTTLLQAGNSPGHSPGMLLLAR